MLRQPFLFSKNNMKLFIFLLFFVYSKFLFSDVRECVLIEDDEKRLGCYDDYFDKKYTLTPNESNSLNEINEATSNSPTQDIESFGLPKEANSQTKEEFKVISNIVSVSQKLDLKLIIILENDQIWQSVEKIRNIRLKDGYTAEISKGFLSGYALRVPEKKIKLRVRRLK